MSKEIEDVEMDIVRERGEAMRRLVQNEDFKELFFEQYVNEYGSSVARNFATLDNVQKANVIREIEARSIFNRYVTNILDDFMQGSIED